MERSKSEEYKMNLAELFLIAVGLSMDAFAVSICAGLTMPRAALRNALTIGLYFGVAQAVMPLIGYAAATQFAGGIIAYDHWVAFILLSFIGGKMIVDSLKKEQPNDSEFSIKPSKMLPLALATSIDALAIGVSFAFLQVNIIPAVTLVGITTLTLSVVGVKVGYVLGGKMRSKAEFTGGLILILIGLKILLEHLYP
jgi:putative Mn2+ efflux pump MntP